MREPAREPRLLQETCPEVDVARQVLREHLDRDRTVQLLVAREIDDRHATAAEHALDAIAPCGEKQLGQSFPSCFFWPLCLPLSCLVTGGTHRMRETRSATAEPSCS